MHLFYSCYYRRMENCHFDRRPAARKGAKTGPPHECYLCEKCNYGAGPCCLYPKPDKHEKQMPHPCQVTLHHVVQGMGVMGLGRRKKTDKQNK